MKKNHFPKSKSQKEELAKSINKFHSDKISLMDSIIGGNLTTSWPESTFVDIFIPPLAAESSGGQGGTSLTLGGKSSDPDVEGAGKPKGVELGEGTSISGAFLEESSTSETTAS